MEGLPGRLVHSPVPECLSKPDEVGIGKFSSDVQRLIRLFLRAMADPPRSSIMRLARGSRTNQVTCPCQLACPSVVILELNIGQC